jgi:hypothetical protein
MKRMVLFFALAAVLSACAETNPSRHSAREFAQGRTFLDGPRRAELSDEQRKRGKEARLQLAEQAKKLGDSARAARLIAWPERWYWTEEKLAKRNEYGVWFAEQDPSPGNHADVETVRAFKTDRTTTTWSAGYGLQISYTSPDGRVYLWYPGNNVILQGEWKVEPSTGLTGNVVIVEDGEQSVVRPIDSAQVCFKYGANTVDGVSRSPGGRFSCQGFAYFKGVQRENRKGDVFGLMGRSQAPFVLPKDENKIANILKKMKSSSGS